MLKSRLVKCLAALPLLFFSVLGDDLSVSIVPASSHYQPGDTVVLGIKVEIPEGFHLYGNPLGPGIGKPLQISVEGAEEIRWVAARKVPAKKYTPDIGDWVWAYEEHAAFFLTGVLSPASVGKISGTVTLDGLICRTACVPIKKDIAFSLKRGDANEEALFSRDDFLSKSFAHAQMMPLSSIASHSSLSSGENSFAGTPDPGGLSDIRFQQHLKDGPQLSAEPLAWDYEPVEGAADFTVLIAIFLALIAGLMLNVMPGVLPVLGITVLSISQSTTWGRKTAIMRSLAFAAGMVSVFMVLASFAAFASFSWGEQFRTPAVPAAIIAVIFVFVLRLFYTCHTLVPAGVAALKQKNTGQGYLSDFAKGMFTAVLASPFSGPFLGVTLAWTLGRNPVMIYLIFAALGIGMATPYVLLASSRRLMKVIPKPGQWMNDFKHLMGFLLLGFAVYLMFALPKDMVLSTVLFCVFLAFSVALYGRYVPLGSPASRRLSVGLLTVAVAATGWYASFQILHPNFSENSRPAGQSGGLWKPFSPELLRQAHAQGNHVVVNFTAEWCMTCQYNKVGVLQKSDISALLMKKDVVALNADLTRKNPAAESLLHHLGSRGVPFLAVFPGDKPFQPHIMRDLVSKKQLGNLLKQLPEK